MNSAPSPQTQETPVDQIVSAILNTAAHPDLITILNDVGLVLNIIHKVTEENGGLHPRAIQVLKSLL